MTTKKLDDLLAAARSTPPGSNPAKAQEAVFRALLDATVYAHVPVEEPPHGRIRFFQFVRPDNGQAVLPFFSDRTQAEQPLRAGLTIVAMAGRRLFELTRGATLVLNPNLDTVVLYPPEVTAILEGRELGYFAQQEPIDNEAVLAAPPSIPTNEVDEVLRELFEREGTVKAAYLVEVHTQGSKAEVFILLAVVAHSSVKERLLQLVTLTIKTKSPRMDLPLSIGFIDPGETLPYFCHKGIQFYGT